MNYNRPDVYRSIHKALRKAMFEFSYAVGRTDYSDELELSHLNDLFNHLIHMLNSHGEKEDKICLPLLESKRPGCTAANEAEHEQIHKIITGLQYQMLGIIQFGKNVPKDRIWNFYYSVNEFISIYLKHMQMEEIDMTRLFYELCTDEELNEMSNNIIKSIHPNDMSLFMKYMLPSLLPQDRLDMLMHIKHTAPAMVLEGLMKICETELPELEFFDLQQMLVEEPQLVLN